MKRIFIALFIIFLSIPVFSLDFDLGPCVFLNFPIPLKSVVSEFDRRFGIEDLFVGADAELRFGILQFGAIAGFNPATELDVNEGGLASTIEYPGYINLTLDAGLAFKILILRLGIGAGPTLQIPLLSDRAENPIDLGINVKGNVDLVLGGISVRLNLATFIDLIQMTKEDSSGLSSLPVYVGISVLFKII